MEIDYQTFMMIAWILATTVGVTVYIARLATRVAVLEAGHDAISEDLKEIRQDVKELLRAVTS